MSSSTAAADFINPINWQSVDINEILLKYGEAYVDINVTVGSAVQYGKHVINLPLKNGERVYFKIFNIEGEVSNIQLRQIKSDNTYVNHSVFTEERFENCYTADDDYVKMDLYVGSAQITKSGLVRLYIYTNEIRKELASLSKVDTNEYLSGYSDIEFDVTQGTTANISMLKVISLPKNSTIRCKLVSGTGNYTENTAALYFYYDIYRRDNQHRQGLTLTKEWKDATLTNDVEYISIYIAGSNVTATGNLVLKLQYKPYIAEQLEGEISTLEDNIDSVEVEVEKLSKVDVNNSTSLAVKNVIKTNWNYWYSIDPSTLNSFNGSYLDAQIRKVPKGRHFIFVTDTHFGGYQNDRTYESVSAKNSNYLISYVKQRLGIKCVVFGGDCLDMAPDKYLGAQLLSDYADEFYSAFGKDGIWVQGNHDCNISNQTAGYEGDIIEQFAIPDTEVYKRTVKNIEDKVVFDEEGIANLSCLNLTSAALEEAVAWFKMHYYYDDSKNKIRFVVLETSDGGYTNTKVFGINNYTESASYRIVVLERNFIVNAIKTAPTGYAIVILGHMMHGANLGAIPTLYYNFRKKTEVRLGWRTSLIEESPNMVTYMNAIADNKDYIDYDFSGVDNNHQVIVLGGHWHSDFVDLNHVTEVIYRNNIRTEVSIWDGSTVVDGDLLCVSRNRDVYGGRWNQPYGYEYSPVMTAGTITESSFDVVTIKDDGSVEFTRFGPGSDLILPKNY